MFDFLKKKLKESIEGIKKAFKEEEEQPKEELQKEELKEEIEEVEELKEEVEEKPAETKEEKIAKEAEEEVLEEVEEELKEEAEEIEERESEKEKVEEEKKQEVVEEKPKEKKGFFAKIFGKKREEKQKEEKPKKEKKPFIPILEKKLSEEEFENFFRKLEISFLEANIAYEVIQLIKEELKKELVDNPIKRGKVEETILNTIKQTFEKILLEMNPEEIIKKIEENKSKGEPTKILFLGVNGVGKTTSLAKMCYWLQSKGYSVVISASDTFRAASIEQLEIHANKLGVKVIKHEYGADPAAVAYDAIEYAKAHKIDVVLIDSAGRQHSNTNLMDELAKIKRVAKPDFTIFVADALTGNDAVEQAKEFGKIGFDAIILGKADVDQKGGAILSVSYVSGKPILFLGVGQDYKDLEPFDKEKLLDKLLKS
ncbi:MAG: signal recognition particle-docking protein FtsY [Nanoarchaeota archaeon]|nr:signal recognition particle-docking protein FtsY [Nanoarchaeota archaeon]